jgi:hypothetical protein
VGPTHHKGIHEPYSISSAQPMSSLVATRHNPWLKNPLHWAQSLPLKRLCASLDIEAGAPSPIKKWYDRPKL